MTVRFKVALALVLTGFAHARPAFADVLPPNACLAADEGKSCLISVDASMLEGTCTKQTCTRATPSGPMTYDCFLCLPGRPDGGGQQEGGDASSDRDVREGGDAPSDAPQTGENDADGNAIGEDGDATNPADDASNDAQTAVDAPPAMDGGPPGSTSTSSCGCRSASSNRAGVPAILGALVLAFGWARRRRTVS